MMNPALWKNLLGSSDVVVFFRLCDGDIPLMFTENSIRSLCGVFTLVYMGNMFRRNKGNYFRFYNVWPPSLLYFPEIYGYLRHIGWEESSRHVPPPPSAAHGAVASQPYWKSVVSDCVEQGAEWFVFREKLKWL
jgi:hypothetical protein